MNAETIANNKVGDSLTVVSPQSHHETKNENETNHETDMRLTETVDNKEIQDLNISDSHSLTTPPLKKSKNKSQTKTEIQQETPYCEELRFRGLKVRHFQRPDIEGEIISEPRQLGLGWLVIVEWEKLHDGIRASLIEQNYLTALVSDQVDFKQWQEGKNNG